jgi:PAS domain S-box-containing protein
MSLRRARSSRNAPVRTPRITCSYLSWTQPKEKCPPVLDDEALAPEFGQFFRTSSDLMSVFDASGQLIAINPAWHDLLGWDSADLEWTEFIELVHPDDRARTLAELDFLTRTEDASVGFENRQRRRDGTYLWFEWNSQRRGKLIYAIGRDITRRLETFAKLDQSTETMRAIFDAAADSIIVVNRDLVVVESSLAVEQIYGYPIGAYRDQSVLDLVHPDDRAAVSEAILGTFKTEGIRAVRFRALHADGRWIEIDARGQALRGGGSQSHLAVIISRDVTEVVASQAALAESLATTRAIFDTAVDIITTIDRDLNVVSTSPASVLYTGLSIEERTNQSALDIINPEDHPLIIAAVASMFDDLESISVRYRARGSEGRSIVVESRGQAIDNMGQPPIHAVVITRDITSSVDMEVELAAAKLEAERANFAKSEFLSRMSHELRTPLNSVLGFAQLLQMEIELPAQLEMVDLIYKSGKHLLDLINEVLDISRVESNTFEVELAPVALLALIQGCVDLIAPMADNRHIAITLESDDDVDEVYVDAKRLNQILINLLSNAVKYNHVDGTVVVSCARHDDQVRVSVADTGLGIAPDLMDRLFTPFDRLGAEGSETEGTGLGLALVKTFAEAMNATVGMRSELDEGSTFWIDLPTA